jgi:hypothetical protein
MVIAEAQAPIRYPKAPMFCVETSVGSFYVTGGHRFLAESGEYVACAEVFERSEFSDIHLLSILEPFQTTQHQDEFHYQGIELNSLNDYHFDSFSSLFPYSVYDEQLPLGVNSDQELSQQPDDVPIRTSFCCLVHRDDWEHKSEHTHHNQHISHLSKQDSSYPVCLIPKTYHAIQPCDVEEFSEQPYEKHLTFWQSEKSAYCTSHTASQQEVVAQETISKLFRPFLNPPIKLSSKPRWAIIKKIVPLCQDENYYDFHVPIYNNYWCQGLIHHNTGKTTIAGCIAAELKLPSLF